MKSGVGQEPLVRPHHLRREHCSSLDPRHDARSVCSPWCNVDICGHASRRDIAVHFLVVHIWPCDALAALEELHTLMRQAQGFGGALGERETSLAEVVLLRLGVEWEPDLARVTHVNTKEARGVEG